MTNVIWTEVLIITWLLFLRPVHRWFDVPVILVLFFASAMIVGAALRKGKGKNLSLPWSRSVPLSRWENFLFGAIGMAIFGALWALYRQVAYP